MGRHWVVRTGWAGAAAVAFALGVTTPALAAEAFSNWIFIHKANSSCGFVRTHIDSSFTPEPLGAATTKNTALNSAGTCSGASGDALVKLPAGYLGVEVAVWDDATNTLCAHQGYLYTTTSSSSIAESVYTFAGPGCPLHHGDPYYSTSVGEKWDSQFGYYGIGATSPDANFY